MEKERTCHNLSGDRVGRCAAFPDCHHKKKGVMWETCYCGALRDTWPKVGDRLKFSDGSVGSIESISDSPKTPYTVWLGGGGKRSVGDDDIAEVIAAAPAESQKPEPAQKMVICANCKHYRYVFRYAFGYHVAEKHRCALEFYIDPVSGEKCYTVDCSAKNAKGECPDYEEEPPKPRHWFWRLLGRD